MPVQTSKAVLSSNWWSTVPLKQSEKFKYLGTSFTSDGTQNSELDICVGKASAVMRQLHCSVVLKQELCTRAKLSIFRSVYVPTLTYGHDCWIMRKWDLEIKQSKWDSCEELAIGPCWTRLKVLIFVKFIFKHRIPASLTRKIATALVWTCDMNAPRKNSKKTVLFNINWLKA